MGKHTKSGKEDKRVFTPEGNARRLYALRHNQLSGFAAMARINAHQITVAPSATPEAKELAAKIWSLAGDLPEALKTRVDPPKEES